MLNQTTKAQWLAGWTEGARVVDFFGLERTHRELAACSKAIYRHNPYVLGYVAALASAVGGLGVL